jgi:hypothetical protein
MHCGLVRLLASLSVHAATRRRHSSRWCAMCWKWCEVTHACVRAQQLVVPVLSCIGDHFVKLRDEASVSDDEVRVRCIGVDVCVWVGVCVSYGMRAHDIQASALSTAMTHVSVLVRALYRMRDAAPAWDSVREQASCVRCFC